MMYLAAATSQIEEATTLAKDTHGILMQDARSGAKKLPFRSLVMGTTDRLQQFADIADVGLYLVCRRVIKPGVPKVVGLFPLIAHPDLGHDGADAHWRDKHAPLALEHHPHMTAYDQISVVHRFSGLEVDGFALCGFASEEDLRERFYANEESVKIIAQDVATFANVKRSPRRLIATPSFYV